MADTLIVQSKAHAAMRITEPMPEEFRDKPGEAPPLKSAVLNGANHPGAKFGAGITHGVDAGLFHAWLDDAKKQGLPLAKLVSEVSQDEVEDKSPPPSGFQPGLAAMKADPENATLAAKGSTVTASGPVASTDMAAASSTPNDDTPRGDPSVNGEAQTQVPATAKVVPPVIPVVVPPAIPPAPVKA